MDAGGSAAAGEADSGKELSSAPQSPQNSAPEGFSAPHLRTPSFQSEAALKAEPFVARIFAVAALGSPFASPKN